MLAWLLQRCGANILVGWPVESVSPSTPSSLHLLLSFCLHLLDVRQSWEGEGGGAWSGRLLVQEKTALKLGEKSGKDGQFLH